MAPNFKNIFDIFFFHVQKIRWIGPREKTAALFFLRCVSSFRLRWIISLEWLKIEKSDVWISNYSVFLSDLSDLSPMLERLYKQVEQPSCSERKSAPITDHRSLPTNHRIIEEHQVEQARIFKRKRRVSTLNALFGFCDRAEIFGPDFLRPKYNFLPVFLSEEMFNNV